MKNSIRIIVSKIKKKYILRMVILLLTLLFAYAVRGKFISPLSMSLNQSGGSVDKVAASKGTVCQYFTMDGNVLSIDLLATNSGQASEIRAGLYLADTNELLAESNAVVPATGGDETGVHFDIKSNGLAQNGTNYYLKLDCSSNNVNYCVHKGQFESHFYQNGIDEQYQLRMSVTYKIIFHMLFFVVFLLLCIVAILICFSAGTKFGSLQNMFVIVATTAGIAFAFIGPAVQECDGWDHFLRAMDVSYGNVLGSFTNLTHADGEIIVPENLNEFHYETIPATGGATEFTYHLQHSYFSSQTTTLKYSGGVTSVFYWPQGLGVLIARIMGLSMYGVVVMSRLFNLVTYVIITYFAISIMPMFRNIFTLIALLPMTLYQAASDSPDALLNAFCFLFIALCFRYAYSEEVKLTWRHAMGLGLLLTCIFMCKYVYICIGLLVFMIPSKRFENKRTYWKSFGLALIPLLCLGSILMVKMVQSVSTVQAMDGGVTQLQYIGQHPKILLVALLNTGNYYFKYYVDWLNTLGSMSYPLNLLIPVIPAFIVGVGCLDVNEKTKSMRTSHKFICFFAFTLSMVGLLVALYIGDGRINPVGADMILGGQGRYFIAVMVLAVAALASKKVENHIEYFSTKVVGAMSIMLSYAVLILLSICYK